MNIKGINFSIRSFQAIESDYEAVFEIVNQAWPNEISTLQLHNMLTNFLSNLIIN